MPGGTLQLRPGTHHPTQGKIRAVGFLCAAPDVWPLPSLHPGADVKHCVTCSLALWLWSGFSTW